jgi:hypothetical protein
MNVHKNNKGPYSTMAPESKSANKTYKGTHKIQLSALSVSSPAAHTRLTLLLCYSGAPNSSFYSQATSFQPWQYGQSPGIRPHPVALSNHLQPTIAATVSAYKQPATAVMPHVLSSCAYLKCTNNFLCFPSHPS